MVALSALGHPNLYPFHLAIALWCSLRWPAVLALRNVVVFAIGFAFVSSLLVPMMKSQFDFPRPAAALGRGAVTLVGPQDAVHSFPSGHAAFAVLAAAALAPGAPIAVRIALTVFAVLVCVSRISVGAHFPADVVAGALLSLAVVAALRGAIRAEVAR